MRAKAGLVFLLCAVLLTGCDGRPRRQKIAQPPGVVQTPSPFHAEFPSPLPEPTISPTPEPTPTDTPTPEPMTLERLAEIYISFLKDEIPAQSESGAHLTYFSQFPGVEDHPLTDFYVRDLTGDGLPELYAPDWRWPTITVWSMQEGRLTGISSGSSYDSIIANGGIFYHRPGGAPTHDDYGYFWLSPESQELPEMGFSIYPSGVFYPYDHACYYINDIEVTQEEWEERTAPYFALRDAEPTEEQKAQPFLDWAVDMGVDLSDLYPLEQ